MNEVGQIATEARVLEEKLPAPQSENANAPRMPFRTSLVLTREQEDAVVAHALQRIDQLADQLGRDSGKREGDGQTSTGSQSLKGKKGEKFFEKRARYTARYYNNVQDRAEADTVFEHSNHTASLSQRITMQMIARSMRFFFGEPDDTDWFSTEAVGVEDSSLADKIKKHSRFKVDDCRIKERLIEGVEFAWVRNEAVVKCTHQSISQIYKRTASVLMVPADPADPLAQKALEQGVEPDANGLVPALDANGDYIIQGDATIPEMDVPEPTVLERVGGAIGGAVEKMKAAVGLGAPAEPPPLPAEGAAPGMMAPDPMLEPQLVETGRFLLKRDGVSVMPEEPIYIEQVITRRLVIFDGPDAATVFYRDFLCPETAADIQSADLIAHLYDRDVMAVAQMFQEQFGPGDSGVADMTAAVERLRQMTTASNQPKAERDQPRDDQEQDQGQTDAASGAALVEIAEAYLRYDADNDGIQEEMILILDRAHKAPIYYEYLANVTVRGHRPFYVIRPMPVDQRWYGMGSMELFEPEQDFVDLQINRHNFNTSAAGRVDFWNPSNTHEGDKTPNLELNRGLTYTLKAGKKAEETLAFVQLPDDGERMEYLLGLFMQLMQMKSGVVNSADQQMSGLPASDLATGINEIRDSGDELFDRFLAHLFPGIRGALRAVIDILYANMDEQEVFNYFNGEAHEILLLTPDEVRDLSLNVTLVLSRSQQRKTLETGEQAQMIVGWYYSLPPFLQDRATMFTRQRLKGLGVSQADRLIEPVPPELVTPPAAPGEEGGGESAPAPTV